MKKVFAVLMVLAAMVAPMAASANWKHKGADFVGSKAIPMNGDFAFVSEFGGINCTGGVKMTLNIVGGSNSGTVSSFVPEIANCDGTGLLAGCTVTLTSPTSLPWQIHNNNTDFTITSVHFDYAVKGFVCPVSLITLGKGNMTVTVHSETAISSMTLEGTLPSNLGGNVTVSGTLIMVNASDKGTYGVR